MNITYKQARAHAQQCGVNIKRFQAVPVLRMNQPRVLARDVVCPETLKPLCKAGTTIHRDYAFMLSQR
jgi:hypothetical protein